MNSSGYENMPERFSKIVDAVCEKDRLYFELHPDEPYYIRQFVPGEVYPVMEQFDNVIVTLLAPGVRARRFTERAEEMGARGVTT